MADIEVGATDDELRLCVAIEAARQGELRLAGQQANLQAAETRATSVLSWAIAGLTAMAVLALDQQHRMLVMPSAAFLATSATACISALWPKKWHTTGYTRADIDKWQVTSELDIREALASGYETCAAENKVEMDRMARMMMIAWLSFAIAPVAGILVVMAFSGVRV